MIAQGELHRFYAPDVPLTDEQVLEHIEQAKLDEPSLAQRTGKHYKQVFDAFKFYADQVGKTEWELINALVHSEYSRDHVDPRKRTTITVMPIAKPVPDLRLLSRAILAHAKEQVSKGKDVAA